MGFALAAATRRHAVKGYPLNPRKLSCAGPKEGKGPDNKIPTDQTVGSSAFQTRKARIDYYDFLVKLALPRFGDLKPPAARVFPKTGEN